MDAHRYRIEPAPHGQLGWLIMKEEKILLHCREKEEAERVLGILISRAAHPDSEAHSAANPIPQEPSTFIG
jgi:hypothetical protein